MAEMSDCSEGQVTEDYGKSTFSGRGTTDRISSAIDMGGTYTKIGKIVPKHLMSIGLIEFFQIVQLYFLLSLIYFPSISENLIFMEVDLWMNRSGFLVLNHRI